MVISVIIPAFNEEHYVSKTLSSLLAQRGDFEIFVVDGESTDATLKIASEYPEVRVVTSAKGRANQMNYGASLATGEILLFLHADTILPNNAYKIIKDHFKDPEMVGGSFILLLDKKHPILKFYSWCSRWSLEFFTYGDHAIFVKSDIFKAIGGYKAMSVMEDVEIQKRLKKAGKFKKVKAAVLTSARRFEKTGTIKQLIIDVLLVGAFKVGVPPDALKAFYKDHSEI